MTNHTLQPGDRVRIYGIKNSIIESVVGQIVGPKHDGPWVTVVLDPKDSKRAGYTHYQAHPKQCRRLKNKAKPRRIWVTERALKLLRDDDVGAQRDPLASHVSTRDIAGDDVEFVEVRK